jgi:hypothetical protein
VQGSSHFSDPPSSVLRGGYVEAFLG